MLQLPSTQQQQLVLSQAGLLTPTRFGRSWAVWLPSSADLVGLSSLLSRSLRRIGHLPSKTLSGAIMANLANYLFTFTQDIGHVCLKSVQSIFHYVCPQLHIEAEMQIRIYINELSSSHNMYRTCVCVLILIFVCT